VAITDGVADNEGNLITGAAIFPVVPFDFRGKQIASNGSSDMLVAKLDAKTGNAIWVLTAGDAKDQATTDVAATSTGIGVAGTFTGTLDIANGSGAVQPLVNPSTSNYQFLAGLRASDGSPLWAKAVNLGSGKINRVAGQYGNDHFLVCGSATNTASALGATGTAGGGKDVLVAAIKTSDGTVLWAKIFGGAGNQECFAAALDDSGNAVFTGTYAGTLDFGSGAFPSTSNAWVAKFDGSTGALMAAKPLGTGASSVQDAGVAGTKLNPTALATNAQNDIVVGGSIQSAVTFGAWTLTNTGLADAIAVKLSGTDLSPTWARRWGQGDRGSYAGSAGVAFDSLGNATVVGTFQKSIDIGGVTQTGGGVVDGGLVGVLYAPGANETVFVVTLDGSAGQTLCANAYGGIANVGYGNTIFVDRWAAGGTKDSVAVTGSYKLVIDFGAPNTALSAVANDGFLLEM
jgi:hypothetical protein